MSHRPGSGSAPSTPRSVKVCGIIVTVLVLLFVGMHLTGNSLGSHTPLSSVTEQVVLQP